MTTVFVLLLAFQAKHFVADYPLQSPAFFLGKFRRGWDFLPALVAHALIHGALTALICMFAGAPTSRALALGAFDACVHGTMDRIKAGHRYMGRWKPLTASEYPSSTPAQRLGNKLFWNALGFDQMVHHLTHYAVIWWLVGSKP
jgi:hypothetical protein